MFYYQDEIKNPESFIERFKITILSLRNLYKILIKICYLRFELTRRIILIKSHFQILRCEKPNKLNPFLLLYLLNKPIVKTQVSANIVVQSTIPTIGERTKNIILPIPKDEEVKKEIIKNVKKILEERAKLRKEIEDMSKIPL